MGVSIGDEQNRIIRAPEQRSYRDGSAEQDGSGGIGVLEGGLQKLESRGVERDLPFTGYVRKTGCHGIKGLREEGGGGRGVGMLVSQRGVGALPCAWVSSKTVHVRVCDCARVPATMCVCVLDSMLS